MNSPRISHATKHKWANTKLSAVWLWDRYRLHSAHFTCSFLAPNPITCLGHQHLLDAFCPSGKRATQPRPIASYRQTSPDIAGWLVRMWEPGMHGRVHIVEVPLIGRELTIWMHEPGRETSSVETPLHSTPQPLQCHQPQLLLHVSWNSKITKTGT